VRLSCSRSDAYVALHCYIASYRLKHAGAVQKLGLGEQARCYLVFCLLKFYFLKSLLPLGEQEAVGISGSYFDLIEVRTSYSPFQHRNALVTKPARFEYFAESLFTLLLVHCKEVKSRFGEFRTNQ